MDRPCAPPRRRPRRRAGRPRRPRRARALGLHARVARGGRRDRRRLHRRARRLRRARDRRRDRAATSCPGFIDAHMHLESVEAARRRVRAARAAARDDRGRRRPARDRERARRRRRPLAARRVRRISRSTSTSWRRRACRRRRSSRRGAPLDAGRPRGADAPAARARARRDDELPRRRRRATERAREARARRRRARRRPRARASSARSCRRTRPPGIRSDHEALHGRGGARAAARRDVAADPRGVDGAQPARAAAARRASTARTGSRSAPTTAIPRTSPTTGHINGMVREAVAAGIAPEDALVMASLNPALVARARRSSARSRPGYQADLLVLPDLERLRARARAEARPAGRGHAARPTVPDWVRQTVRVAPRRRRRLRDPLGAAGRARAIGLVAGPGRDGVARRASRPCVDGPGGRRSRRATSRRSPSSSGTSRPAGSGSASSRGSGLQRGALASTVAHDAHNLVVVGMSDDDMAFAVERLVEIGGGIVAVDGRQRARRAARCRSPGLLSDAPLAEVIAQSRACNEAARGARLDGRDAVPDAGVPRRCP